MNFHPGHLDEMRIKDNLLSNSNVKPLRAVVAGARDPRVGVEFGASLLANLISLQTHSGTPSGTELSLGADSPLPQPLA